MRSGRRRRPNQLPGVRRWRSRLKVHAVERVRERKGANRTGVVRGQRKSRRREAACVAAALLCRKPFIALTLRQGNDERDRALDSRQPKSSDGAGPVKSFTDPRCGFPRERRIKLVKLECDQICGERD